jgi:hypothetical protein
MLRMLRSGTRPEWLRAIRRNYREIAKGVLLLPLGLALLPLIALISVVGWVLSIFERPPEPIRSKVDEDDPYWR